MKIEGLDIRIIEESLVKRAIKQINGKSKETYAALWERGFLPDKAALYGLWQNDWLSI